MQSLAVADPYEQGSLIYAYDVNTYLPIHAYALHGNDISSYHILGVVDIME